MVMKFYMRFLGLLPLLFLAACDGGASESGSPAASVAEQQASAVSAVAGDIDAEKPNFVVISQPSYPPFAMRSERGEMVGVDIDLLNEIAKKEGFTLTILPHNMSGLLESLDTGAADIVAAGIKISPERAEKYDFSKPYLEGSWVALLDGSKPRFSSFADLHGKTMAVQQENAAEKQLKSVDPTIKVLPVKTVYLGVGAVAKGEAVGVYDVDSVLHTYAASGSNYYMLTDEKSGKVSFGFAVAKGNTALKNKLDNGLNSIRADGTYQKVMEKWFPK